MAAQNATPFPVNAQAFRLHFRISSAINGNPITGGLTGLASQISKDGASFTSTTNSPAEIATTGYGAIDLTAAEMTCGACVVRIYATNSNQVEFSREIVPMALAPFSGRWDAQSIYRLEQMLMDTFDFLWNQNNNTGAQQQLFDRTGTLKASGVITEGDTSATRGKLA